MVISVSESPGQARNNYNKYSEMQIEAGIA
jgi:hypothetical protein